MRGLLTIAALSLALGFGSVEPVAGEDCPPDAVRSGTVCIDKYEASLWYAPLEKKDLIDKIQQGVVNLKELTNAGAVQLGLAYGDLAANGCPVSGNGCVNVYAVSIPGVTPSRSVNWFQAVAAARNSHKRLPTNQEWQAAALGTPEGDPCNVDSATFWNTGSAPGCISDVGAFDMVGNVGELVADWGDLNDTGCTRWPAEFSSDLSCFGGTGASRLPGAFLRSGYHGGNTAGVFTVRTSFDPTRAANTWGFRCAR